MTAHAGQGPQHDPNDQSRETRATLNERLERELAKRDAAPREVRSGRGFGRMIVAIYAILAISATARAVWQLADHGATAPVPYALSLFAGIVYLIATVALAKGTGRWRVVAWIAVTFEAVGVLAVGFGTLAFPGSFPDQTVWSGFGQGYGYIPLILPFVGMFWLWRTQAPRHR